MFLQLDSSPPVVNSIDWTWFGKPHTCYIRSHSWQYMSEQKPSREVEGIFRRAPRQDHVEAQIWERGTKKSLQHWRSPRTQWSPSFLNRRSLELVSEMTKNLMVTLTELMVTQFLCGDGKTFQKDNHLCCSLTNQAFMVEWPNGSHSSVKSTWQSAWRLPKGTKGL